MTCCVYSFDGMCPCMDDERWRCGAKIWFKELVLTTLLQHTMIGCEDNVATNHEHCSKFYYPDKRLQRNFLDIERNQFMVYK